MTTKSENKVIEEYTQKGYYFIHSGYPDFIFYKVKPGVKNPKITDIDVNSIEFVEVKYNGDELNHEQQICRHILQNLNLKYKLIHIPLQSRSGIA